MGWIHMRRVETHLLGAEASTYVSLGISGNGSHQCAAARMKRSYERGIEERLSSQGPTPSLDIDVSATIPQDIFDP